MTRSRLSRTRSGGESIPILHQGKVQQIGTPRELYAQPRNLFAAGFIGSPSMNFMPAEIDEDRLVLPLAELALPAQFARSPGRRQVIAGIRPEHLQDAALIDTENQPGIVFEANVDVVE